MESIATGHMFFFSSDRKSKWKKPDASQRPINEPPLARVCQVSHNGAGEGVGDNPPHAAACGAARALGFHLSPPKAATIFGVELGTGFFRIKWLKGSSHLLAEGGDHFFGGELGRDFFPMPSG